MTLNMGDRRKMSINTIWTVRLINNDSEMETIEISAGFEDEAIEAARALPNTFLVIDAWCNPAE